MVIALICLAVWIQPPQAGKGRIYSNYLIAFAVKSTLQITVETRCFKMTACQQCVANLKICCNREQHTFCACRDCDTCRWMQPHVYGRVNGQTAVVQQPEGDEEILRAAQALLACPTLVPLPIQLLTSSHESLTFFQALIITGCRVYALCLDCSS